MDFPVGVKETTCSSCYHRNSSRQLEVDHAASWSNHRNEPDVTAAVAEIRTRRAV